MRLKIREALSFFSFFFFDYFFSRMGFVNFQVQESFEKFQGNHGSWSDSEIGTAEMRKTQLLGAKGDLDRNLAFNYQMRAQLQMELQTIVSIHNHPRK